jgi:uncharacterized protein
MNFQTHTLVKNPSLPALPSTPDALHDAAEHGDSRLIRALIADGFDVDARDERGQTPLIVAIRHRQLRAAAELIAAGASLSVETRTGWTPLSVAVKSGNPFMIELIASTTGSAVRG